MKSQVGRKEVLNVKMIMLNVSFYSTANKLASEKIQRMKLQ